MIRFAIPTAITTAALISAIAAIVYYEWKTPEDTGKK